MSAFIFVARGWPKTVPIMLWFSLKYRKSPGYIASQVIMRIILPQLLRKLGESIQEDINILSNPITENG